jgi:hypothetical protein
VRQHDLECVERACSDIAENDAQCRQRENGEVSNRRAVIPDRSRQCKHVATAIAIDLDPRLSWRSLSGVSPVSADQFYTDSAVRSANTGEDREFQVPVVKAVEVRVLFWAPRTPTDIKDVRANRCLQDANGPGAVHSDSLSGSQTQIEADAGYERAPIVDDHHDGLPGPRVRHGQARTERKRAMSGGQAVGIEWLSAGGVPPLRIIG